MPQDVGKSVADALFDEKQSAAGLSLKRWLMESVHSERVMARTQPARFAKERGAFLGWLCLFFMKGELECMEACERTLIRLNSEEAAQRDLAAQEESVVHILIFASIEIVKLYAGIYASFVKKGFLYLGAFLVVLLALLVVLAGAL